MFLKNEKGVKNLGVVELAMTVVVIFGSLLACFTAFLPEDYPDEPGDEN